MIVIRLLWERHRKHKGEGKGLHPKSTEWNWFWKWERNEGEGREKADCRLLLLIYSRYQSQPSFFMYNLLICCCWQGGVNAILYKTAARLVWEKERCTGTVHTQGKFSLCWHAEQRECKQNVCVVKNGNWLWWILERFINVYIGINT